MKLLHVSDLHLDSPFVGIGNDSAKLQKELINAPLKAFERCVSIAINEAVDLMIISGDIYNSERQTVMAQYQFVQQLDRLNKHGIKVVLVHGNHDYLRSDRSRITYPDNVSAIEDREVQSIKFTLDNGQVFRVHGFSYQTKWIHDRVVNEFPENMNSQEIAIGILHGAEEGAESDAGNYAPFNVNELLSKHYDYWALGHIHKAQILNQDPLIQYAGTTQGRHHNELGDKGCYIIEIEKGQKTKSTFYSLAPIVWQEASIECQFDWESKDIMDALNTVVANYSDEAKANQQSVFVKVKFNQAQRLNTDLLEQVQNGEFLTIIQTDWESDYFVYIHKIDVNMSMSLDLFDFDKSLHDSFNKVVDDLNEGDRYKEVMTELFDHAIIQRYFNLRNDSDMKNQMINSARELIVQLAGFDIDEGGNRMKIKTLDIFGYGHWINQSFEVNESIQLFYGRNETGKSTLMSFIKSILFGFPSKRRRLNKMNRYEPKNSNVYGGRILLLDTTKGNIWVERTKSDLKLYTESGEELPNSDLDDILGGLDETLFDSFYSFNLANLQELANVGSDQLNNYFLSIGTLGSDKFLKIAKDLDKETSDLYKPKGIKPPLNQQLDRLESLVDQANKAKEKMNRYNQLISQREDIDQLVSSLNKQLDQVEVEIRDKDKLISRYDTYLKLRAVEKELQGLVFTQIPEDKPMIIQNNIEMIQVLEEENIGLNERINHIQAELTQLTRYNWAKNHEEERKAWRNQTEQIKEVQTKYEQTVQRIQESNETITQLAHKGQFYPEKVENTTTYEEKVERGLSIEAAIIEKNDEIETIKIQRKMLLDQRKNLQNKSATLRQNVAKIEHQRVNQEEVLMQNTRLSEYFIGIVMMVVGVFIVLFNIINQASFSNIIFWIGIVMLIAGGGSVIYVYLKHRQLMNEFNNHPLLEKAVQMKEEERQVNEQSRDFGTEINEKEDMIHRLEEEREVIIKDQQRWLTEIGFYPTADPGWILKANPIKQYFVELDKREAYENELSLLQAKLDKWMTSIEPLLERFPSNDQTVRVLIRHVEEVEASLIQVIQRASSLSEREAETRERITTNQVKIKEKQKEIQKIYNDTQVKDRAEFDQRVLINQKINDLSDKQEVYREQIAGYEERLSTIESKQKLFEDYHELERRQAVIKGRIDPQIRDRANLVVEIRQIEQDGSYSELLQQIENQKAELLEMVEEWGIKKLASDIITQTLRKGLDNPVSEMNDIADKIFATLSYNRYTHIKMNKNDIKVKQFSDVLFAPHELSQGTLEQLYVALRLAFVISAQTMIKMPIIIDDAFVNFDEFRKTSMYKVLQDISEDIQILFFTFDQQAQESFHPQYVYNLEDVNKVERPESEIEAMIEEEIEEDSTII
ncbi:AAA family ATPase [Aerococcaceae bacterium WGS1372]